MFGNKAALQSMTIIGALVMGIMFALRIFGLESLITEEELSAAVKTGIDAVNGIIFVAGFVMTVVGRLRARKSIAGLISPTPDERDGITFRSVGLFLAVSGLCLTSLFTSGCDDNQRHRAAVESDRAANIIRAGIKLKRELRAANLIDATEELAITRGLFDVNRAVKQFRARAEALSRIDAGTRAELLQILEEATAAVAALARDGTLHFKNAEARQRIGLYLESLSAVLGTIRTLLPDVAPPASPVKPMSAISREPKLIAFAVSHGGIYV